MKARKYFERNRIAVIVGIVMVVVLVTGLAIIIPLGLRGSTPATKPTPTPTTGVVTPTPTTGAVTPTPTTSAVTPTPTPAEATPTPLPGVILGPQACPNAVKGTAYWDTILGTGGSGSKVEVVSCANILGNPSLQSLVTVRHNDANRTLDVYVFNNITNAKPTQLFKLQGLVKGDAKISGYNSVMTAQVDPNSSQNVGKPAKEWTADLYREFEWNSTKGTLVQVAFPGIFPDLTRYQAENDQARVNQGKDTWKNDPAQVAKALAVKFLQWDNTSAKVLSGGGSKDVYATVRVTAPVMPNLGINVTLSRLEGNTHNMWVVISVEDGSALTLTSITSRSLVASPVKLEGKGAAFESQIGKAIILDHLYTDIGHAQVSALPSATSPRPYSVGVIYTSTFQAGVQEGVIEVQLSGGGAPGISTAVMAKVLLDPVPRVLPGPLACPDAVKDPAHWKQFVPGTVVPEQVGCANLLGKPTLQTVVVGREIVGGGPRFLSFYVFDDIFSAHPKLLFKVEHLLQDTKGGQGNFTISGYSTIMTSEVDRDSSINKGKAYADVTNDLFREFQWSSKDGTFVQVAFPGLYPDLTRWQAEDDQAAVDLGQNSWKLDALQTARHFADQFFTKGATASLVSGGRPGDLHAVVNLSVPASAGGGPGPITTVSLSRLEGNPSGVWEVTSVGSKWLFIYTPTVGATISSPVTVTGFGPQFEAQIGVVYILDHLYQKIQVGDNFAMAPDGSSPPSKFSLDVKYTSSLPGGAQEGIVELVHTGGASFDYGVVMVKVLLNP